MLHMLAVNTFRTTLPRFGIDSPSLTFVLALLLTYVAAEISYRVFESPILRLKARFRGAKADSTGTPLPLETSGLTDREQGR